MEYRKALRGDLQGILALYPQLSPDNAEFSPEKAQSIWSGICADPMYAYFIAADGDRVVATCNITVIPNLTHECRPFAVIENVITDISYRKRGIGGKLIEMAIQAAKQAHCYKILLLSGMKRTGAHAFYEKLGFNGNSKKGFELRLT